MTHDSRCISLTDSEFNRHCDCELLRTLDAGPEVAARALSTKPSDPSTKES